MVFENIGQVWRRASLIQRILILGVVLGCVGAGVMLVNWARQPSYALLYGGLTHEEAASMVEKIRDAGIAYELRQGGTAVYVPQGEVYSLRLTLASAGLPTGDGKGYRMVDDMGIGVSPNTERFKHQIARQQEIARTIETLDAVASARVHIVLPNRPLLGGDSKGASATVVVKLKGNCTLTRGNVGAIAHIVSGAVEGLDAQKVVIVDAEGNLFSGETEDEAGARMASVLEQKRSVEEYLARKAQRHLMMVLGPNRATVQVAVTLNTTTIESEKTVYGPDKGLTVREMIQESRSTEPPAETGGEGKITSDTTTETEMKVSEEVKRTIELAGDIQSKTVSVVVDLRATPKEGEDANSAGKIMELADVEDIVKNALGLTLASSGGGAGAAAGEAAGTDSLTVKEATFYAPPALAGLAGEDGGLLTPEFLLEVAQRASLGFLVLGALLALRMFRGKKPQAALTGGAEALPTAAGGAGMLTAEGEANPEMLKARITRALQDNPEEVKRLFLSWIQSEKGEG